MEAERFSGGTPAAPSGNRYQCSPISAVCGWRGRAEGEGGEERRGRGREGERGGGEGSGKGEGRGRERSGEEGGWGNTGTFLCTLETFDFMNLSQSTLASITPLQKSQGATYN